MYNLLTFVSYNDKGEQNSLINISSDALFTMPPGWEENIKNSEVKIQEIKKDLGSIFISFDQLILYYGI